MKKIKLNTAKLQLQKEQITALDKYASYLVIGGDTGPILCGLIGTVTRPPTSRDSDLCSTGCPDPGPKDTDMCYFTVTYYNCSIIC